MPSLADNNDGQPLYLGIDVAGTSIAAAVVAPTGTQRSLARVATSSHDTAEQLWQALVHVSEQALTAAGSPRVAGIGCGCAGPMRWPDGIVSPLNLAVWRDFPLARRIGAQWPGTVVRVHNNAVCVAVAEHWVGSLRGSDNALGMVVSTGVGGGLISAGNVVNGGRGNAGHIGHIVVDPQGPPCACGGVGCLEAVARGPATLNWAQARGWQPAGGQPANVATLVVSAAEGDPVAIAALRRSGTAVGQALASVAAMLDLDAVAIGGGLMNAGDLILGPISEAFYRHAGFAFVRRMRIVPAATGQDAGVLGAAGLVAGGDHYWPAVR